MTYYYENWDAENFIESLADAMLYEHEAGEAFDAEAAADAFMEGGLHELIDNMLIYDSDILELWGELGRPEPCSLGMADTIAASMAHAVYETLWEAAASELLMVAALGVEDTLEDGNA